MLAGVEVEHEVGEGAFEAGTLAEVDDEAGAGDLGGALEVEDAEGLAELPVGLGGEVEGGDLAPGFFLLPCSSLPTGTSSWGRLGRV